MDVEKLVAELRGRSGNLYRAGTRSERRIDNLAADALEALAKELAEAKELLRRGRSLSHSYLNHSEPSDLPEDASQQWQQLEHWAKTARRFLEGK